MHQGKKLINFKIYQALIKEFELAQRIFLIFLKFNNFILRWYCIIAEANLKLSTFNKGSSKNSTFNKGFCC